MFYLSTSICIYFCTEKYWKVLQQNRKTIIVSECYGYQWFLDSLFFKPYNWNFQPWTCIKYIFVCVCTHAWERDREREREFCVSPCSTVQLGRVFCTHVAFLQDGIMHKHAYVCIYIDKDIYIYIYLSSIYLSIIYLSIWTTCFKRENWRPRWHTS